LARSGARKPKNVSAFLSKNAVPEHANSTSARHTVLFLFLFGRGARCAQPATVAVSLRNAASQSKIQSP
jgi:hypothetical protein